MKKYSKVIICITILIIVGISIKISKFQFAGPDTKAQSILVK